MAIEFNCPHCKYPYKLKEEFGGREAFCKNPDCKKPFIIPKPDTKPNQDDGSRPKEC